MKLLKSPLFVVCSILFLLHQLMQYGFGIRIPLVDDYLDNLVAMPIILTLLLWERRTLFGRGPGYTLTRLEIILATIYVAILSEFVFSHLSRRFTFDWLDFVFFFAGAFIFAWVHPPPNKAS